MITFPIIVMAVGVNSVVTVLFWAWINRLGAKSPMERPGGLPKLDDDRDV